ncbi:hypothetical protein BV25DRAFT_1793503 [Artomyces pyxidatus]|uniref:Uncharacterized protein n=1 Tax=Artomyces pyxidatus TaxID=48021 RepID=A0ACB8TIZ4_9AGAM|nr:hypothetical protein BV25DRAFT_1793503 [Artomyces pyxidatus]
MEVNTNAFASLARLQLPPHSRLLPSACCPDKDLVVIVSRLGGKDRMGLWKMQGSKKWEVDVDSGAVYNEEIVDLAWSPDGQTIVLIHHPPRITFHSVQDGHQERYVPMLHELPDIARFTGVWWLLQDKRTQSSTIPDIFKRGSNITGSAHSLLKLLPLLDPVKDDTQALTATDLFAFQGMQMRPAPKANMPAAIAAWPALASDPLTAAIQPSARVGEVDPSAEEFNDADETNLNSILAVSDSGGRLHCFLDGSYPLGAIRINASSTTTSLYHDLKAPILFAHQRTAIGRSAVTSMLPVPVHLTLLGTRIPRDVARISTTARELLWYTMRVMEELRVAWYGSDTQTGAREPGIKWLQTLDSLQAGRDGAETTTNSLLDLTIFLVTGRSTDPVSDFIGSGEQMSERGLQRWEATVVEALIKLRDFSEQRVAPACQRLHLVLEEVLGWSQLPQQYGLCELNKQDVVDCMAMAGRAVIAASWLSGAARRELARFKEFMKWLRYEIGNGNPTIDPHNLMMPRHDILEVNSYLISGLVNSPIDDWFTRGIPTFSPQDLGVANEKQSLPSVMERARRALKDPAQTSWQHPVGRRDLSHIDKNLDTLVQELANRCGSIFLRACSATARSTKCFFDQGLERGVFDPDNTLADAKLVIRERKVEKTGQPSLFTEYLAIYTPGAADRTCLCLFRLGYQHEAPDSLELGVVILECRLEGGDDGLFDILDMDFFDNESLVILYRTRETPGPTVIATVGYAELGYQDLQVDRSGSGTGALSREGVMLAALQRWKAGEVLSNRMPIKRSRALAGCREGDASLAVNGRLGRRVACVLDLKGTVLEVVDLEGDGEDEEEEGE